MIFLKLKKICKDKKIRLKSGRKNTTVLKKKDQRRD